MRSFIAKLDTYADEHGMEEAKEFLAYPISHNFKHKTLLKLGSACPCDPPRIRNQYLDN